MEAGSTPRTGPGATLHSTRDYYLREPAPLGWELTLCNALQPEKSPCRKILKHSDSYGALLYAFLSRSLPMEGVRRVIEVGGGHGYLMRDFLKRDPSLEVTLLDISPFLSALQERTLEGFTVDYRVGDFLQTDPSLLHGKDLAILNEVLGDFPVALRIPSGILNGHETSAGDLSRWVLHLFDRYPLQRPETPCFDLNLGALESLEKLCSSGIPYVFLCEHSCEAGTPAGMEGLLRISSAGHPERIPLKGHDEYTIQFSQLVTVARAFGYQVQRGPLAHVLEIDSREEVRCVLASPSAVGDEEEILRHFVEDVYKYEYLLLSKTPPEGGPRCLRCGNCCVTDLFAFVTDEDMARWAREGRDDILHILKNEAAVWAGDRLVSGRDGHPLQGCPFLTLVGSLATCTIHETRPKVCRNYVPGSSELCPHYKGGEP